jgi:cytochrome c biogenesis protein CcmG/thiol:disulfide interchange protein DsbE
MRPVRLGAQALSVLLVAGLLALLVWKVSHQVGHTTIASEVRKGKRPAVPTFSLPQVDGGGTLASASIGGKVGVINFWASWCIPCREETPLLDDASRRWAARGVAVLGIDHQDFAGDARRFVSRYGMTYPTVVDKGDKLYTRFGLTGVPETFCSNRAGEVVAHVPGAVTRDTLDQCIRDALSS